MADNVVTSPFLPQQEIGTEVSEKAYIKGLLATHSGFKTWYNETYLKNNQVEKTSDTSAGWNYSYPKTGQIYMDLLTEVGINDTNRQKYTVLLQFIEHILTLAKNTPGVYANVLSVAEEESILEAIHGFMPEKDMDHLKTSLRLAKAGHPN